MWPWLESLDGAEDQWPFLIQLMLKSTFQSLLQSVSISLLLGEFSSWIYKTCSFSCLLDFSSVSEELLLEVYSLLFTEFLPCTSHVWWFDYCSCLLLLFAYLLELEFQKSQVKCLKVSKILFQKLLRKTLISNKLLKINQKQSRRKVKKEESISLKIRSNLSKSLQSQRSHSCLLLQWL